MCVYTDVQKIVLCPCVVYLPGDKGSKGPTHWPIAAAHVLINLACIPCPPPAVSLIYHIPHHVHHYSQIYHVVVLRIPILYHCINQSPQTTYTH